MIKQSAFWAHGMKAACVVVAAACGGPLTGCSQPSQLTPSQTAEDGQGEVPEGFESWDDYWKAQDQREQALDRSRERHEIDRTPTVPR